MTVVPAITASAVRTMPKVEVHVHLDGAVGDEQRRRWAPNGPPPGLSLPYRDLNGLIAYLDWVASLVDRPARAVEVARSFAFGKADDGVRYVDVIVNPSHWEAWSGNWDGLFDALDRGFTEAEQERDVRLGVCLSLARRHGAAEAAEVLDWLLERRPARVVALSLDGNEATAGRVSARFADAYRRAAEAGLHRTAHAGESSGPEGVWDAIELLGVERIDHGVRAIEDPALVALLAQRAIPLDVCPSSNVALGLYPSLAAHPLPRLRAAGVRASINTDGPTVDGLALSEEYARCAAAFGWGFEELRACCAVAIDACFAPPALRADLHRSLAAWQP